MSDELHEAHLSAAGDGLSRRRLCWVGGAVDVGATFSSTVGDRAEQPSEFQQGHDAGRQDQTLADHTDHLQRINGSIDRTGDELESLRAEVRSLREEEARRAIELREKEDRRADELARRARNFRWWVGIAFALLSAISAFRGSPF